MQEIQTQETAVLRVPSTMKNLVEALIFAAQEPLTVKQIKGIYEQGGEGETRSIDADEVRGIVAELNAEFQQQDKPYRILQIAGGFQFATLAQYAEWLGKLYKEQARRKLSKSSTETLAIIAYKQPIGRPEIEAIRGVNCDYVLATLLEKDLVTIVGRASTPGRPLLYGTTREFLKHFGLNEITDLPRPREIEEILGESQFETERRMLEAQAGALEMKKEEEDFKSRLPHIPKRKPDLGGEVKIVERKKQREIKTAGSQEQDEAKHADQEKLDFADANRVDTTPVPLDDTLHIEPSDDMKVESTDSVDLQPLEVEPPALISPHDNADKSEPEQVAEPPLEKAESIPEEYLKSKTLQARREPVEEYSEPMVPFNAAPAEPTIQQPTPAVSRPGIQPKSAWHSWKQKIQTFIKKLFG
ncbi:MAG: SMC-Scp complex subunit ScpB [Bacteroidota bacterium]